MRIEGVGASVAKVEEIIARRKMAGGAFTPEDKIEALKIGVAAQGSLIEELKKQTAAQAEFIDNLTGIVDKQALLIEALKCQVDMETDAPTAPTAH